MASSFVSILAFAINLVITVTLSHSLFTVSEPSQLFTWMQANLLCNSSAPRGQLVSIHNASYDNHIRNLCASDSCWIGLFKDSKHPEWQWMDDTPTDYRSHCILSSTIPSCVALSATASATNIPTWSTTNCFETLPGAVCSTCGSLNEYCCNVKSRCNGDHLHCVDNKCVALMASTEIDTSVHHVSSRRKQYLEWSIETGAMLIFFVCLCSALAAHIRKTNRERMKRNKRNMTTIQRNIEYKVTPTDVQCLSTNDDDITATKTETNPIIIDELYSI